MGTGSPTPAAHPARPMSAMIQRPNRSSSRMSASSRAGGSRASDEDGRTSVKVVVRVRPPLKSTDPGFELVPARYQTSKVHALGPTTVGVDDTKGDRKIFVFDRVFPPETNQDGVWGYLEDSINSFVQGYNVSVLAYGQSGAGKSYTMGTSGPVQQDNPKSMGVIPRAATVLFEKLGCGPSSQGRSGIRAPVRYSAPISMLQKQEADKTWTMKATYVEIYNESLRDLLVPEGTRPEDRPEIVIREEKGGKIFITGLHQVEVNSLDDLIRILSFGSSIRQTDATSINAQSSRSHAVFSLNLVQKKPTGVVQPQTHAKRVSMSDVDGATGTTTLSSKMHFVDLAGSERLKNTHAQGTRAKEGIAINAGLASLGKVISQLSKGGGYVSYRDSKLTRMLQDSLGGNAVTYMIACVTPAEFYITESLNTIQYAQRARAIQSKPKIQAVSDESDLKAVVERLKQEVAFLREQLKTHNESTSVPKSSSSRVERSNEKEIELQNQLLDLQESYTALNQRHAKLISEITRARDTEEPAAAASDYADSAFDRLKRSNSLQEAVETVILEYEKTIQSLESSVTQTRSSLSNSEEQLLEKETKLAYLETLNTQLQSRAQKMADRESNTESYLRSLEEKLSGQTSGDEKNQTVISELKNEIARLKDNESSGEDYIANLEERLAEAESENELLNREISRLEQVVERQRNIGRLEHTLAALDSMNERDSLASNGVEDDRPVSNGKSDTTVTTEAVDMSETQSERSTSRSASPKPAETNGEIPQSPAQTQFVNEKLEEVQQELIELKVEHESTITEYDQLTTNYEAALRDISKLHDQLEEARHARDSMMSNGLSEATSPPMSPEPNQEPFLGPARLNESKDEGQHSSSRSLSSELSLAGISPSSSEATEVDSEHVKELASVREKEIALQRELERLRQEREEEMRYQEEEQTRLHEQLKQSMDQINELRAAQRANGGSSPLPGTPALRRKSSQSLAILDRAQRAFTNLKRIASENFKEQPEVLENFELNLDGALRELQTRSERIQELENDITSLRNDMDRKTSIINGLTRERSQIQASPMDISVIAAMERRLEESEGELQVTQQKLTEREMELESAKRVLETKSEDAEVDASALLEELTQERAMNAEKQRKIAELTDELQETRTSQEEAFKSLRESHNGLEATIQDLESKLTGERTVRETIESESLSHRERIMSLQATIDENKGTISAHLVRVEELEAAQIEAQRRVEESGVSSEEMAKHLELGDALQKTISESRETIEAQQSRVDTLEEALKEANAEMEAMRARELAAKEAAQEASEGGKQHEKLLNETRHSVGLHLESLAKLQASYDEANALITKLQEEKALSEADITKHTKSTAALQQELEDDKVTIQKHLTSIKELQDLLEKREKDNEALSLKERNHAKLLSDVEEQLTFTFDEKEESATKLAEMGRQYETLKQEMENANAELKLKNAEAQKIIDSLREEVNGLKTRLVEVEYELTGRPLSNSSVNNVRKSNSNSSLPSPPPDIPLPPLPASGATAPPMSRRPSKDYVTQSHYEDQDARIKTLEKQLKAEKELTSTLEEALTDCEKTMKRLTSDRDSFQAKASQVQQELDRAKNESQSSRYSMQAVEEERLARMKAEQARAQLEERMQALSKQKKRSFACF